MPDVHAIADQSQRSQALDPGMSFIVQAPAGSGKTGLLVQRIIRLLSLVDSPEEIIAITFTRKAAGEMRERILKAFTLALQDSPPEKEYERVTWELARAALARDRELGWGILENPGRLRIQTIDSFCSFLARQMPLLSRFGAVPSISDDPEALYREAARNAIAEMESGESWSAAIEYLVRHLDNRLDILQQLIATMLSRRDQWLRHVADPQHPRIERGSLEAAFARLIEERLALCLAVFPVDIRHEILELLPYCIRHLQAAGSDSPILHCEGLSRFPAATADQLDCWKGLAAFLLTADGSKWRSRLDKNIGFLPDTAFSDKQEKAQAKAMKERMKAVLSDLSANQEAHQALAAVSGLPTPRYSDEEWQTLNALFEILRISAASLELVFRERTLVDFTAMSQAANLALGDTENPTDLALALDYRIQHILVDEFQDTSWNQFELIRRLTAGWQPDDGRSLFLVGDPMQSIYRFREAEVGLFLEAWKSGIGSVRLQPLQLSVNFRSQGEVVEWINQTFRHLLPAHDDIANGAVSYAPSVAFHETGPQPATHVHPILGKDFTTEAQTIVQIIRETRKRDTKGSIAVLVRGRKHLAEVVHLLKQEQIRFRAIEIESLAHRPVIKDLLSLTRALLNPADRVAWLACLRAPWCGVSLMDLETLAASDHERTVLQLLQDDMKLSALSMEGQARVRHLREHMTDFLGARNRDTLRTWIEYCWYRLGGPACVQDETDLANAEEYFGLLDRLEEKMAYPDFDVLTSETERLYASPDVLADESLQVMTIHKSKGLEFDTVILPGLGRMTGHDDSKLMNWIERPLDPVGSDLLLAPIKQTGEVRNEKYGLLATLEKQKSIYETGRLLYVATTRAKKRLHLLGHVVVKDKDGELLMSAPPESSLLASLWTQVSGEYEQALQHMHAASESQQAPVEAMPDVCISRLQQGWNLPLPPACMPTGPADTTAAEEELVEFTWAGEIARHIGTVVHRYLQRLGETGLPARFEDIRNSVNEFARQSLLRKGVASAELEGAIRKVEQALEAMLGDERGKWILDRSHSEIRNEYPLSYFDGKDVRHYVIDRTFRERDQTRWIIDYKTGAHLGGGMEAFLDREVERYRHQLDNYARIFSSMEPNPIRLGLYFPLMRAWREWEFKN